MADRPGKGHRTLRPEGAKLICAGVSKRYRRNQVLAGVELALHPGELVRIRGGNGSGKSTLLRIAAGFTRPSSGWVVRGAAGFGWVPDQTGAFGTLTARAHLMRLARIRGLSGAQGATRITELGGQFTVQPGLDSRLSRLSKGNQQKVLLMQAFLAPAELLFMDEPTAGLDTAAIETLRELTTGALRAGSAVLLTDHSGSFSDLGRPLELRDGQLVECGTERP